MDQLETHVGRPAHSPVPDLVEAFWRAVAALSGSERYQHVKAPGRTAAKALLHLASIDAEMELRSILRPDPDVDVYRDHTTFTVACYEIGCVAPAGLHEIDNACDALANLVSCEHRSHVASELICSGQNGSQWVALVRADRRFTFQFPDLANVSAPDPTSVAQIVTRWSRHVSFMELSLMVDGDSDEGPDVLQLPDAPQMPLITRIHDRTKSTDPGDSRTERPADESSDPPDGAERADRSPRQAARSATPESSKIAELNARREKARLELRKTVATQRSDRNGSNDETWVGGDAITSRTLSAALRSSMAEVVPFLERYLLDAVSTAVEKSLSSGGHAPPGGLQRIELPDAILGSVRAELKETRSDLRNMVKRIDQTDRLEAQALQIEQLSHDLAALRTEFEQAATILGEFRAELLE